MVLRTAQLEAIGSTEEFALPQTGMFNPRKGENVPARSLPRTPGLSWAELPALCRDGRMEPDSVSGNGISRSHLRKSEGEQGRG